LSQRWCPRSLPTRLRIPITLVGGLPRRVGTGASTKLVKTVSAQDFPTDHWSIRSDGVFRISATALPTGFGAQRSGDDAIIRRASVSPRAVSGSGTQTRSAVGLDQRYGVAAGAV